MEENRKSLKMSSFEKMVEKYDCVATLPKTHCGPALQAYVLSPY